MVDTPLREPVAASPRAMQALRCVPYIWPQVPPRPDRRKQERHAHPHLQQQRPSLPLAVEPSVLRPAPAATRGTRVWPALVRAGDHLRTMARGRRRRGVLRAGAVLVALAVPSLGVAWALWETSPQPVPLAEEMRT